jgi:hypothetical protein
MSSLSKKGLVDTQEYGGGDGDTVALTREGVNALSVPSTPSLTDLERKLLDEFKEENGAPAGLVAQNLDISTATVTKAAKKLQAEGLLEDTGSAMKFERRTNSWQWIDKPKTEGGMVSKPGASTVWRATLRGHGAIGHEPSPYVTWAP